MMHDASEPRVLGEGRWLQLVFANGWEWVTRHTCSGAVVIVAVTEHDEIVLVEQYRVPLGAAVIDLPAGLVGDEAGKADEPMADAGRRELLEETGFQADEMLFLTEGPTSAGLTDESHAFYLARGVHRVAAGGGDAGEQITVHVVPLGEVPSWLDARRREGALVSPKVYAALYFASKGGEG